ncbi:MAG TPA: sugar kinase [Bryobacteraceae bacterium]|nr:sugar kinase [Bryobacteraceae bacterium]
MDAVCLGILVADLFASPIDALPQPGELKTTSGFLMGAGGCASNTAACLRRLGRTVRVVGKVGEDLFGDFVVRELGGRGIDTSGVTRSRTHQTSSTVILNVLGQDRRYLHVIGANSDFTAEDVDPAALDDARVMYVGGYPAMPGFRPADLAALFEQARRKRLVTVLDVVIPAGFPTPMDWLAPVLPFTDYFLPNEDEARALTGLEDPHEQAKSLWRYNPGGTVVITRGERGSLTKCGTVVVDTPAFPVEAVDESGAGDAFSAGLITGVLEQWPLQEVLLFASAAGASCTRALGCIDGVFTFEQTVAFLENASAGAPRPQGAN